MRVSAALAAAVMVLASCGGSSGSQAETPRSTTVVVPTTVEPNCTESVPYTSGEGGYATYRIPAAVATDTGAVLAFAEGRRDSAADHGAIDTLVRRSTDGGCTWGKVRVVTSAPGQTRNNPAPVFDPATKKVILLTMLHPDNVNEGQIRSGSVPTEDSMRVFQQDSADDGLTFSEPHEITAQVKEPTWRWYAMGPGHGTVLTHGKHAGRIVFGANHSIDAPDGTTDPAADRFLAAHAIYSDDHGKTWHIGFVQDNTDGVVNGNETTVAELPDGRVYFNTRNQYGSATSHRADAVSDDGGATLTAPLAPQDSLAQVPVVEASLLQLRGTRGAPLLLSAPSDPNVRIALTIFTSTDGGKTWQASKKISDAPAGYSDLVALDATTVGLLYETGEKSETEKITFRRLPVADITTD